jgi:MFS family permease
LASEGDGIVDAGGVDPSGPGTQQHEALPGAGAPERPSRWRSVTGLSDLGGASALPIVTLFGLNLADEFDRLAFATLTPEIRDAFGLSDSQIVAVGSLSALFVLISSIPVGYLADRLPRLRLARLAAAGWGAMGVLLGLAWAVPVLFFARFFSGVAKCSNEVVHLGLLADYYEPRVHPRIFQLHRLANPMSQVASVVAGGIGLLLGWRWAFILLAIPTFVLLSALGRLSEPDRGATIDPEAAALAATQPRLSYRAATKHLLRIRTLRRFMVGFLIFGVGLIAFNQMLVLFFEDVYGFGPLGRGFVAFLFGAGQVLGMLQAGRVGMRFSRAGSEPGTVSVCATGFACFAGGALLLALAPWWPGSILGAIVAAAGLGIVAPTMSTLLVAVVPPPIRAQGQSFTLLAIGGGALLALPLAALGDAQGYRAALVAVSVITALSVPVLGAARRSIVADAARARSFLAGELDAV